MKNIEEEEIEEEQEEEEPEEEEEDDTSSSEEEGEADDDNEPDPWHPLRQKVGKMWKKPTWKKSKSSLIGENPNTMPKMPLFMPYYL